MRRPLGPNLRPDLAPFTSPFERLLEMAGFSSTAMPPYMVTCATPLFTAPDLESAAQMVGLAVQPQGLVDRYPRKALRAENGPSQHPTSFLQWGWAIEAKRQALFEIGDSSFLTTLHFMRAEPQVKDSPWHLDSIVIDTGGEEFYNIPCDEPEMAPFVGRVLNAVSRSVCLLNTDDWQGAEHILNPALREIVRELDDISERLAREHAQGWMSADPHARPSMP